MCRLLRPRADPAEVDRLETEFQRRAVRLQAIVIVGRVNEERIGDDRMPLEAHLPVDIEIGGRVRCVEEQVLVPNGPPSTRSSWSIGGGPCRGS